MPIRPLVAGVVETGTVETGTVETRQAVDGEEVLAGDVVQTGADASTVAEVRHANGAVTRLDAETEVTVDREWTNGRPRVVVTLGPGRTWHRTGPLDDPTLFEVRCPTAVLTARFACFALFCDEDGSTSVTAVDGNVVVRGREGGSVALADGQRAVVGADGVVSTVEDADPAADAWVRLNQSLDAGAPLPPGRPPVAQSTAPAAVDYAGMPRWVAKVGAGVALAVFVGVLALTFVTADNAEPVAAPSRAAAVMHQATTTTAPPTVAAAPAPPPPPAPAPAPTPTATVNPTSCRQAGRTVIYGGTLTNTSTVPGSFAVDAVFMTKAGAQFGTGTATLAGVEPGQTVRWEVRAPASGDLRNSGASCETAGLRVLA